MTETRNEIIDLAEVLIRTKGYHAFSYKDISVPLNIKNAAVHYHFPAKEELGLAIIDKTLQAFYEKKEAWQSMKPTEKLDAFIGVYESSQQRNLVCIMGALGPSYDFLPQMMKEALTEASVEIKGWLKDVLEEGLQSGDFHFSETPQEKTNVIISSLLSSLILIKVTKENILASVKNAIIKSIKQ